LKDKVSVFLSEQELCVVTLCVDLF
jgi:hypothetical protein